MLLIRIILLTAVLFAGEDKKSELKNVQVLPFTEKADIMKYMKKTIVPELGVKCKYCHNLKDFSSDKNEHKVEAREMMRMVMHINTNIMQPMGLHEVSCWVCHRGQKHPDENDEK